MPWRHPAPVEIFDQLDSTNAEARRRAEAGQAGPLWIVARRQTAGRGRRGRDWSTPAGNLAATLLLSLERQPSEAAQLTFVAALAVCDLVRAYVPASLVAIKWPNDVMIAGTKTSGILLESGSRPGGGLWVAVGCGVNLGHAPTVPGPGATSIMDHLRGDITEPPTLEAAVDVLTARFDAWRDIWANAGFTPIARAWTERAQGLGQACVARLGAETVEGVAEAMEADGALRLRLADGSLRRISAGDVFFADR